MKPVLACGVTTTLVLVGIKLQNQKNCLKNIEKIEWLGYHDYYSSTDQERKNVQEELEKQQKFYESWKPWDIIAPTPNWRRLRADDAFFQKFHEKQ